MPGTGSPTLSRRLILEQALNLMDRDGYAAFSMPKLGDLLGVRTPSLYHHFRDRSEILAEVARAVVLETERPARHPGAPWTEYFVELSVNFRRTLLRHRNTAPVLVQFLPRDVLAPLYERNAQVLREESGLPIGLHALVLDGLERLAIGTALIESSRPPDDGNAVFRDLDPTRLPGLAAASRANAMDAEQLFVASVRAFLAGVESHARPGTGTDPGAAGPVDTAPARA